MSGKYNPLKFETSTEIQPISYEVELTFDEPLISDSKFSKPGENKKNIWYGIKEKIETEENGFNATEHLHAMIELKGYKRGSKFYIKKLKSDKFTYFVLSDDGKDWKTMNDLHPSQNISVPIDIKPPVIEQKEPNDATKLNILWNAYQAKNVEKGHKEGDDDLPF